MSRLLFVSFFFSQDFEGMVLTVVRGTQVACGCAECAKLSEDSGNWDWWLSCSSVYSQLSV